MRWIRRGWAWSKDAVRYTLATPAHATPILGAFVVGAAFAFPAGEYAYNYVWSDPAFCSQCHVHDYADEAFHRSKHAGVSTCHDCHVVPFMHYPPQAINTVLHGAIAPEDMPKPHVATVYCSACHTVGGHTELAGPMTEDLLHLVVKVDDSPLHRVHLDAERRAPAPAKGGPHDGEAGVPEADEDPHRPEEGAIACMDCHGSENNRAHRFRPSRDNCLQCHAEAERAGGRLDTLQCQECHFDGFVGTRAGEAGETPHP